MRKIIIILFTFALFSFYNTNLKNLEGRWELYKMTNDLNKEVKKLKDFKFFIGDTFIIDSNNNIAFISENKKTPNEVYHYILGNDNRVIIERADGSLDSNFLFNTEVYMMKTNKDEILLKYKGKENEKIKILKLYYKRIKK